MMNVEAILTEIGQALSATGVNVFTSVPDANDLPAIVVQKPTSIIYQRDMGNGCEIRLPITLYVQGGDLATAWKLVYQLLSFDLADSTPIADAVLSHQPTNYKALQVTTASNFRVIDQAIQVDVNLTIITN